MNNIYVKLERCLADVRRHTDFVPDVALVLGSGLGGYGEKLKVVATVDYKEIEDFPVSTAPGHAGRFLFGYVGDVKVVCMQGRVHYYEGYSMQDVVLPARLMKMMGAKVLFLTNAAGGLQLGMKGGDLMLIKDQIASFVPSPLIGTNIEEFGPRFPDMSEIYNRDLQQIARRCAMKLGIELKEGVYMQFTGPQYETPHEVAMARVLGADVCGMSTASEAIAANHMGMKIIGISCITNLACGISPTPLSHEEVTLAARAIEDKFTALVTEIIKEIGKTL